MTKKEVKGNSCAVTLGITAIAMGGLLVVEAGSLTLGYEVAKLLATIPNIPENTSILGGVFVFLICNAVYAVGVGLLDRK